MKRFATLDDVPLKEAWANEPHGFTPWLAENMDRLSEAVGIPLEHTGTEVSGGQFAADLLARNPQDRSTGVILAIYSSKNCGSMRPAKPTGIALRIGSTRKPTAMKLR